MCTLYFNGLKVIHEGEYLSVYMPEHHLASKKGTVYIHRLVAEQKLHRPLLKTEFVHHIDENKFNNDEENLLVFRSSADHSAYHNGCGIMLLDDVWIALIKLAEINTCSSCGKQICANAKMCENCYNAHKSAHIPDKDVLQKLIDTYSYEYIGSLYGVSGKAIRKWCDKRGCNKQTRYDVPSRETIVNALKNYDTRKDAAKFLNVPPNTLITWEQKFNIIVLPKNRIKCVETNQIFDNKRMAARFMFPDLNPNGCAHRILHACRTDKIYNGYHWQELEKEVY